jgi:hypothetical protein
MQQRLFNAKQHKVKFANQLRFFTFLIFTLGCIQAFCQGTTKHKADTLSLTPFEYAKKNTNNGSDCICSITNPNTANIATVVVTGAPDSMKLNSTIVFNGTHVLTPGQQIIAVGNFMGKQLIVMNLSVMKVAITVMLFCPN